jgi:MFS family permease
MKYETRLIWVLTITFGFVFFDRNATNFLMPFIAADLHFSNGQIGLVASALSFTWAVAGFLGGAYSDRTGNRKGLLLISVVAFSLCSFISGLAASFIALFSTRLLMGLAEGPILPIAQSLVALESSAAKRGNNMGVMQNFGSNLLGSFVAPLVLVAIASTVSWRWAFYLSGVPGLVMAVLIAKYVHQPTAVTHPPALAAPALAPTTLGAPLTQNRMSYARMIAHRNMWLCMLMAIFMVAWMVLGWAFLPIFYTKFRHLGVRPMSILMSVLGLSAAFFASGGAPSSCCSISSDCWSRSRRCISRVRSSCWARSSSLAGPRAGPFPCSWGRCPRRPFPLAMSRPRSAWWRAWAKCWAGWARRRLPAAPRMNMVYRPPCS